MAHTGANTSGRLDQEMRRTTAAGRFSGFPGVVADEAGDNLSDRLYGVVNRNSTADIRHMNKNTVDSMLAMATEYTARTGKQLSLTDGYRSFEEQVEMKKKKGDLAATPGTSAHGYGTAFDMPSKQVTELREMGLLEKHGFRKTVTNEGWHIEKVSDTKAASADKRYKEEIAGDDGRLAGKLAINKTDQERQHEYAPISKPKETTLWSDVKKALPAFLGGGDPTDKGLNELRQIQSDLTRICAEIGNIRNEDAWLTRIRQEGTNTWVAS